MSNHPDIEMVGWDEIPKDLIDDAEILLRSALQESGMCFAIQHGVCSGIFDKSLAITAKVDLTWNDLSQMGLLVYLNTYVFHPNMYALSRNPKTGESEGAYRANEAWEYPPEHYQESRDLMAKVGILVEGWNIEWSDH